MPRSQGAVTRVTTKSLEGRIDSKVPLMKVEDSVGKLSITEKAFKYLESLNARGTSS